jgi:hypothetical protein
MRRVRELCMDSTTVIEMTFVGAGLIWSSVVGNGSISRSFKDGSAFFFMILYNTFCAF